jgi:hypothetical protein
MLIAARSSQDFSCCARATASARSKYASALAASGTGNLSATSPAKRWTSASNHLSLVVSIASIASPMLSQASLNWPGASLLARLVEKSCHDFRRPDSSRAFSHPRCYANGNGKIKSRSASGCGCVGMRTGGKKCTNSDIVGAKACLPFRHFSECRSKPSSRSSTTAKRIKLVIGAQAGEVG